MISMINVLIDILDNMCNSGSFKMCDRCHNNAIFKTLPWSVIIFRLLNVLFFIEFYYVMTNDSCLFIVEIYYKSSNLIALWLYFIDIVSRMLIFFD